MLALLTRSVLGLVPVGASVLDVGAGLEAPYQYGLQRRAKRLVLLDAHQPYLDANQTRGPNVERVLGITPAALRQFRDGEFDVAFAIDHIEHLSHEDGQALFREMQRVARTVGIFTPLGKMHQEKDNYLMGGDLFQTHRSGWTVEDFRSMGCHHVAEWNPIDPGSTGTGIDLDNYAATPTAPPVLWAVWHREPAGHPGRIYLRGGPRGPKVLITGGFDPAGVCLGHRDALLDRGYDARVALDVAYTRRHLDADWVKIITPNVTAGMMDDLVLERRMNHEGLLEFAKAADVIQVSPGINHVWDKADPSKTILDLHLPPAGKLGEDVGVKDWFDVNRNAARVAYFHGSLRTWEHREEYAKHYRNLGYLLAASTLDYACSMGAAYLPPVINGPAMRQPRQDGEPLVVIHTPTDRKASQSKELIAICRDLDIELRIFQNKEHRTILREKRLANVGVDHLRGSFSVNHLENCDAGLASLCSLLEEYELKMVSDGFDPMPCLIRIKDANDLRAALSMLKLDPKATRDLQRCCSDWVQSNFNGAAIGLRLHRFYGSL